MRYVIVCLIKGNALKFHEKMVSEVSWKFNVRRQRLPAHFTIKAPFETDRIGEIEKLTEDFVRGKKAEKAHINEIGHFRDNVIYMGIEMSEEALHIYNEFIEALRTQPYLEWKRNEGGEKVFHCTLATHLNENNYNDVWQYLSKYNPDFPIYFDNISILRWEKDRWITYKEFMLRLE